MDSQSVKKEFVCVASCLRGGSVQQFVRAESVEQAEYAFRLWLDHNQMRGYRIAYVHQIRWIGAMEGKCGLVVSL